MTEPGNSRTVGGMKVALTTNDFLRRAELVYPDRVAFVDEPDQPAPPLEALTYRSSDPPGL